MMSVVNLLLQGGCLTSSLELQTSHATRPNQSACTCSPSLGMPGSSGRHCRYSSCLTTAGPQLRSRAFMSQAPPSIQCYRPPVVVAQPFWLPFSTADTAFEWGSISVCAVHDAWSTLQARLRPPLLTLLGDADAEVQGQALAFWHSALPHTLSERLAALLADPSEGASTWVLVSNC